jgi:hypothetical protein
MLRNFILAWTIYWVVVALLPVRSIFPSTLQAFLLQLSFVVLVSSAMFSTLAIFRVGRMPVAGRSDVPHASRLIWLAIAMSGVGLAALMYDKLFVQQIDYSEGVAFAREEWRRAGEEREGQVSSIYSMIGYLFGSAYYVAAVLAVTQTRDLSAKTRLLALLAAFGFLFANSALTGGRSSILLFGAVLVGAFSARRGLTWRSLFARAAHRQIVKLLIFLGAGYTVFIFYQRADAGDVDSLEYALEFLPFLGLEASAWYRDSLDGGVLESLGAMIVLATSYLTHSFSTVAAIVDAPAEDKTIIFLHASTILYKLGVIARPDGDWFLSGRFASFPGALWHQMGLLGFIVGSLVLGIAAALAKAWTVRAPDRLLPLCAFVMAEAVLLMTPAVSALDFLSFPFIVGSIVFLVVFARLYRRKARSRKERSFDRVKAVSASQGLTQ